MKILTGIDVPFQPFGGSLLVCDDWYSNLPDGVEVCFLTLPNPTDKKWWHMENVVMMDIEKTRGIEGFDDYVKQLKVIVEKQIIDFKPDIIHSQHLNYGLSRAFSDLDTTVPMVGICHGTDVQAASQSTFFLENMTHICDRMNTLLFSAPTMQKDFTKLYPKEKDSHVFPLGIPEKYFDTAPRDIRFKGQRTLKVLYAGRLLDWKGADIAVDAMTHTHYDIHLTVIGNEDQQGYKQRLLNAVAEYGLSSKIAFKPQFNRDNLIDAFSEYDVIVFPSRRLEAFSLTVVEAQASGLPVIYHPGGGITDTVNNSAIELPTTDPRDLADILDSIYMNPTILLDAQEKGYRNARRFTIEASRSRLFEISQTLIDHHPVNQIH